LLNGNVHWSPRAARYLELIVGSGLAISRFAKRSIVRTDFLGRNPFTEPDRATTSRHLTLGGGIGAPLPLGTKVEVVPTFRFRFMERLADGTSLGAGVYVYQFGATVRMKL
jgi:hypothetical protein